MFALAVGGRSLSVDGALARIGSLQALNIARLNLDDRIGRRADLLHQCTGAKVL